MRKSRSKVLTFIYLKKIHISITIIKMKEIHLISIGNSLISNFQKNGLIDSTKKISDEYFWAELLGNSNLINSILKILRESPFKYSAELNTFLRVVEGKSPENIEVYLFGTKTASNELCRRIIESYLKEIGYKIYVPYEVSGYFLEACYDKNFALDEFKKGISELIDRLIYIAESKKKAGYKVYFNPTGGLKAHVIATALAAFITECDIYYMNEEFSQVVFFPKLFYLPKGRELELLKKIVEGQKDINFDEYDDEISRLNSYGFITICELDGLRRIFVTEKGRFITRELR